MPDIETKKESELSLVAPDLTDELRGLQDPTGIKKSVRYSIQVLKDLFAGGDGWTDDGTNVRLTTSTDNVAIGLATASSKLVVKGSTSDNTASALNITDSDDNSTFFVQNDGRVGVGTASPDPLAKFHIRTDLVSIARFERTGAADGSLLIFFNSGPYLFAHGKGVSLDSSDELYLFSKFGSFMSYSSGKGGSTGFSEVFIAGGGRHLFGIGTSIPDSLFHIHGPLRELLTGTVTTVINTDTILGSGTTFTSQYNVGDAIRITSGTVVCNNDGEKFIITAIADNLNLTLDSNYLGSSESGLLIYGDPSLLKIEIGKRLEPVLQFEITKSGQVILEKQIQIKGGVPGLNKVLTSDVNGNATWETPAASTGKYLKLTIGTIARQAISSGYTAIPDDDTSPQIDEGAEVGTLSVTPLSATSTLKFTAMMSIYEDTNNSNGILISLFKAGTNDAIQTLILNAEGTGSFNGGDLTFTVVVASHGTFAKEYSIRVGRDSGVNTVGFTVNKLINGALDRWNVTTTPFISEETEV